MKTITQSINIYSFSELPGFAKERAKSDHANALGYSGAKEALKSLEALAGHFDGRLTDYSIDYFNSTYSSLSFSMPEMDEEEIKSRLELLGEYDPKTLRGKGQCKLTGYCMDESAVDGFRIAWNDGERDLVKLMKAAGDSWLKAVHEDCAHQYSDEEFSEHCDANQYFFHQDGSFHS